MRAYIGLGSNLDRPALQIRRAIRALAQLPGSRLAGVSRRYRNPAMDLPMHAGGHHVQQPDYVNAVAALDTRLSPYALLRRLQTLEQRHQRVRQRRWGPRTLDLDLLLHGPLRLKQRKLTVPHPGLHKRAFVLYPLRELAPALVIPARGAIPRLTARLAPRALHLLPPWQRRLSG